MCSILDLITVSVPQKASQLPAVAMIGVGSMGGAILAGLRAPHVHVDGEIAITTHSSESAAAFANVPGIIARATAEDPQANQQAVRGAKLVILAVKPWMIHDVIRDIAPSLAPDAILVSVAAGVTTTSMEALAPAGVSVVRAMPNTPAHLGLGVTGVAGGASADTTAIDLVRRLFETVGQVLVIEESRIDALSAVSGSGPAYLFLFAEAFTAAAARLGFSDEEARVMAEGTITGAAALLAESGEDPAELRRRVTSPKGTTEQAITVLQTGHWGELFDRAFAAAIARATELAAE